MTIWKRYYFYELMKIFILFMFSFYFLYVLIDYSLHTKVFQQEEVSYAKIGIYYACQFTKRAEILIPIALMISTIKVLTSANLRNEILALATSGVALKKILSPFFFAALLFATLLYLNMQWIHPFSLGHIDNFETSYFKNKTKEQQKGVNALTLEDNTLLIYQTYDQKERAFFDVFWLQECDRFFRIQLLFPGEKISVGKYVDTLVRKETGEIVKVDSQKEVVFPQMHFDTKTLFSTVTPPAMQSLSQLARNLSWRQSLCGITKMNDREAENFSLLYLKLISPLACLLAIIGPAPFCLRFSRTLSVFMIYALSLFGMVTFYMLVNSSFILGQSQIFPPALSIIVPQLLMFTFLGWNYAKR